MAPNNPPETDSDSESSHSSEHGSRPQQVKKENIPDAVDFFLGSLLKAIEGRKIPEIHKLYEEQYNKISNETYKHKRWPSAETVASKVSDHPLFLILYKELYFRHIYSRLQNLPREGPTAEERRKSWENYCMLLDLMIDDLEKEESTIALPAQWLWDIVDEFVYHFQTYCTQRSKDISKGGVFGKKGNDKKSASIEETYKAHPNVFDTTTVLKYFQKIVKLSRVEDYLQKKDGTGKAFSDETARLMGYFSLMQLLRMHCLLGDYHLAMKTIQHIDLAEEVPLFYKIPACHVTLYYYMGFSYMMMRRYADSIRTFSDILVFMSKTSGINKESYQYEAMQKKHDQMYSLIVISHALSPRPLDEAIEKFIRTSDKHAEKQLRLQRGEEKCFQELFDHACPKFVLAAPPDYDNLDLSNFNIAEAHDRQRELFLQEMRQQQLLPKIGSYMKLYTAIKTTKLAQLCEMDPAALRDSLMCVMHKTSQKVRTKGAPLDGEPQHCSEVEFYLDGDMVHINAQRTEREHADVFLEQIIRFQDLLKKMGKA